MTKAFRLRRALACALIFALLIPACALAQDAAAVTEAAKQACTAAGGTLLEAPLAVTVTSPYGTQSVVLRDAPSDSYGAVAMLMVGEVITALGENGEFYFVLLEDGVSGWLALDELLAEE